MATNTNEEIRAFLEGYMDKQQRANFEKRLRTDDKLRITVMDYRREQIKEAQSQIQQIKERLKN